MARIKRMLNIGMLWPFLLLTVIARAQNVTSLEYYVDTDPGFGNATAVAVNPSTDVTANFSFDLSNLQGGFHNLYVRAYIPPYQKTSGTATINGGGWSLTSVRNFYKEVITSPATSTAPNIVAGEFFMDQDPGFGAGLPIPLSPGTNLSNLAFTVDITSIAKGFHNVYSRFKNSNGTWGLASVRNFYKEVVTITSPSQAAQVVRGEYFFDTDPGFGNGTAIALTPGTNVSNISFTSDITSLARGFHQLFIRFEDANGVWSLASNHNFYKEVFTKAVSQLSKVVHAEYYVDADPGYGKGSAISITPSFDLSNLSFPIDMRPLSVGLHRLYVRAQDSTGTWSLNTSDTFRTLTPNGLTITVDSNLQSPICPGNPIDVPFTANALFNDGNVFTALLSDSTGNFTNAVPIGSVTAATSDTIHAIIPGNTAFGPGYRIRVHASNPDSTSADNGQNIQVGLHPVLNCPSNIVVNADTGRCGAIVMFAATSPDSISYSIKPGSFFPVGTTQVTTSVSDSCGRSSCTFTVTVNDNQNPVVRTKNTTVNLNIDGTVR